MARIAFIQNLWFEYMGPMYLSASLKRSGHDCRVFIGASADELLPALREYKPEIVAFSVMTGMHQWSLEAARRVKEAVPCCIVFGGPHPTFFPEIIEQAAVDIICRGEGEGALTELADALSAEQSYSTIANLWLRDANGDIVRNDVRPLCQDLDTLPEPDRELYAAYPELHHNPVQVVISSRGCPYDCTFCFNHQMAELYRGKGRYVRHRSPLAVIDEIKQIRKTKPVSRIYFADDTFALDKQWLNDFLPRYGDEIGIPFHCLVRINQIDDRLAGLMRTNGCETVFFGIESGDEHIRNAVLKKAISDDEICRGAAILKKNGITFRTYNIVGFPGETIEQALKTVQLNIDIGTDFPWCSIFMPYPGTRLADYARDHGFLSGDLSPDSMEGSFHITSALTNPDRWQLANLHKFFQTAVLMPAALPMIRLLIKLPENSLFRIWFGIVYFHLYQRSEGRGFIKTFRAALRNGQFFKKR